MRSNAKWRALTALMVLLCSVALGMGVAVAKGMDKIKEISLCGFVYNPGSSGDNASTAQFGYDGLAGVQVKLEGAQVKPEEGKGKDGNKFATVTDEKGYYQFEDLADGDYTVIFSKDGWTPVTKNVHVAKKGLMPQVNVALKPQNASMVGDMIVGPGMVYVAYAERQASQASNVDGGMRLNTAQTMRGAIAAGADPLSISGNVPPEQRPPDQQTNPTCTDPNHLMILPPNNLGKATFTTLPTKPNWLAFNKNGSMLFVSSQSQMIMVYDSAHGNRLLRNLPTQGVVTDLTLGQDGRYVLAGIMAANSGVMLIDTVTGDPGAYIPCPGPPRATAMGGNYVYACTGDTSRGEVDVMDAGSARKIAAIKVGNQPTGLALSSNGRHLFCVNSGSASVSVIDITTMTEISRIPVGINPQKVAITPDGSRIFVTNKQNNTVSVIDGRALGVIATTPVSAGPIGIASNKDGSKVFVACKDAGSVVILDGKSGAVVQTTIPSPLSSPWGLAVRP